MEVFQHLIYEYKKGVRGMVLCTLPADSEEKVKGRLERNNICYMIQKLGNGNMNVFFGKEECLIVAKRICKSRPLNLLTPEEDFIIGALLGYSISEQCHRYCKKQKERIRLSLS